ncbi:hypothetical protein [Salinicola peritrichatus]|uniref:hypothetical protein n=1 Tax=Salinicola peritrichatus TaxID=1267424 RepID=UPI000DA1750F|nr:hypothetical protein [Salinicola peritrichatus]
MPDLAHDVKPGRFQSSVVAGPWPSYVHFRNLPERDRWVMYGHAKRVRQDMEDTGFEFTETYEQFIARVCRELEI